MYSSGRAGEQPERFSCEEPAAEQQVNYAKKEERMVLCCKNDTFCTKTDDCLNVKTAPGVSGARSASGRSVG